MTETRPGAVTPGQAAEPWRAAWLAWRATAKFPEADLAEGDDVDPGWRAAWAAAAQAGHEAIAAAAPPEAAYDRQTPWDAIANIRAVLLGTIPADAHPRRVLATIAALVAAAAPAAPQTVPGGAPESVPPLTAMPPTARESAEVRAPQPAPGMSHDCDPRLLEGLRAFGDKWGPLGVAIAAASLTSREALMHATDPGREHSKPQPQPAPGTSHALARAIRKAAEYRTLLDEVGVMAANAPEDGDSFEVLEQITMRIAAADVPGEPAGSDVAAENMPADIPALPELAAVAALATELHAEADRVAPFGQDIVDHRVIIARTKHECAARIRQAVGPELLRELEGQ